MPISNRAGCDLHEPRRVLEAMKDGVWVRSLKSPFDSDALAVIRPRLASADVAEALSRGMFHEGKPYDFDFDFTRSDRLVCTEVVYRSYEGVGGIKFQLKRRTGRLTLAAEDLLQMALDRASFEPLAAFCPVHSTQLQTGTDAEQLIRKTHVTSA
jgi:Permuted papain-like amidase enzyme, YaeF/YiiX, C92 family